MALIDCAALELMESPAVMSLPYDELKGNQGNLWFCLDFWVVYEMKHSDFKGLFSANM